MIFISSGLALTACTPNKPSTSTDSPTADVFANRPIGAVPDLTVVTFNERPLLEVATKTSHGWNIPVQLKNKLLAEQASFEKKLKTIDPNAQIVYRYRMTVNGMAIYSSADIQSALAGLPEVRAVAPAVSFDRPQELNISAAPAAPAGKPSPVTSVSFIGADDAHKLGFTGKGMRIGIIDTGIDYTHAMLGGSGKKGDYAAIDPAKPNAGFPNKKVVGGIDLAGTGFNAASPLSADHLPHPDANPLDEAGHGSHVAGTIAGNGDGASTYDGVAPDAQLYAIKVFGKEGSTSDATVIAGFEYAADPDGDLNPDDQLDVVNLSLGGGFGQPHVLYSEAVRNLSRAGTVVVASAGNSGAVDYIVGAPSTTDEAISVAASIDGAPINWQFAASKLSFPDGTSLLVKAIEGPVSKPISTTGPVSGQLVDIGDASTDLDPATAAKLAGKVALIVRGKVSFADKIHRAVAAGAIGALVYNNAPGDPIPMGGDNNVAPVPAIMISQAAGLQVVDMMKKGPVSIDFKTDKFIEEPGNIDTITDFSSKGPRSEDNLIKPEIAAPGLNITSAGMGTGNEGVKMDGTSMASPHMTGAIALIKQAHPGLSALEYKSLAMNTAKVLTKAGDIPITLQGAGRIQIGEAVTAPVVSESPSLSLGRVQLQQKKVLAQQIVLRNLTKADVDLQTDVKMVSGMTITVPSQVHIPAMGKAVVNARFDFSLQNPSAFTDELDGRILFNLNNKTVLQIPALAIRTEASQVVAQHKGNAFSLTNSSPVPGLALAFNLLGEDPPKPLPGPGQAWMNRSCDLQSAAYRILHKPGPSGDVNVIQFAFKLYQPVTTWIMCSVSVLIDSDGDGVADQEIAGVTGGGLEGVDGATFSTLLLDSAKARAIRLAYEKSLSSGAPGKIDYTPAVLAAADMAPFSQSTIAVIEAPLDLLAKSADGKVNIKLASQAEGGETFEPDKFLGGALGTWMKISPNEKDQAFYGMDEVVQVTSTGANLTMTKGSGSEKLVIYYPINQLQHTGVDGQAQIIQ
jgi:subtilisin family serine protease